MLEIIKQFGTGCGGEGCGFLRRNSDKGGTADNSTGGRTGADRGVLVLTEDVLQAEETGSIQIEVAVGVHID